MPQTETPTVRPSFALLRRAYKSMDAHHYPSTKWCEGRVDWYETGRRVRRDWERAIRVEMEQEAAIVAEMAGQAAKSGDPAQFVALVQRILLSTAPAPAAKVAA